MSKTKSFVSKHQIKLEEMKLFNESYLRLISFKLEQNRKKELENLSNLDRNVKEAELIKKDDEELSKLKEKLDKEFEKKKVRYHNKETVNARRIWEIDFVRGVIIIGMLIDHFFYDFLGIFTPANFNNLPNFMLEISKFSYVYWTNPVRIAFRLLGVTLLVFLSGVSSKLSKNSLKRSLFIIIVGIVMSLAFIVVANVTGNMNDLMLMGAVMGIGVSLLIYSIYKLIFARFKFYKWLTFGLALMMLIMWGFISYNNATDKSNFWFYYNGYAGSIPNASFSEIFAKLPSILFGTTYFGSDWLGLFPSLGYMFLGGFIGELLYKNRQSIFAKYNEKLNRVTYPFSFAGRNSVWFYLGHQLVYIIIIGAVALIMGASLNV